MSALASIKARLCQLEHALANCDKTSNGFDQYISGGSIVGSSLVLSLNSGSSVNIPLQGVERAIDFQNLTTVQKNALLECMKGDSIANAFGTIRGHLLRL